LSIISFGNYTLDVVMKDGSIKCTCSKGDLISFSLVPPKRVDFLGADPRDDKDKEGNPLMQDRIEGT